MHRDLWPPPGRRRSSLTESGGPNRVDGVRTAFEAYPQTFRKHPSPVVCPTRLPRDPRPEVPCNSLSTGVPHPTPDDQYHSPHDPGRPVTGARRRPGVLDLKDAHRFFLFDALRCLRFALDAFL